MQWVLEFLLAVLFALTGAESPEQAIVTVHYSSGITRHYAVDVNEGSQADFFTVTDGEFQVNIEDLNIPLYSGDVVCLPLKHMPIFSHRDAEYDPTNPENGCFGVWLLEQEETSPN
jgi:hypothetical protein